MDDGFAKAVRQAALAAAYDLCSVFQDFDDGTVEWVEEPSIARIRDLYPDSTLDEARSASEACRAWASWTATSSAVIPLRAPAPIPHQCQPEPVRDPYKLDTTQEKT